MSGLIRPGIVLALTLALLFLIGRSGAQAQIEVDLALVLAVDVSSSMDPDEQALQRDGFVEAFRSPLVHDAIRMGALGRIAVVYMEWSDANDQKVVVPWSIIEEAEGAAEFAERLARSPLRRARSTSVSGAIDFSVGLLAQSDVAAGRQAIDISGDGHNNNGRAVTEARDEAVAEGITINGLPIMLKPPTGIRDIEHLDLYFRDCVIGGPGAFMLPVRERDQFAEAIRLKLIHEIAVRAMPQRLVAPAQVEARVNCLTGGIQLQ
jgi:Protein of unknown function (DUF1194)